MSKVKNVSKAVKVVKGSGIDLQAELAGIRSELQAQVETQATGVKTDLLARLVILAQAVQELSSRVSSLQDTTSQMAVARRARKPRKPPTPEQIALLAKNRDEWFKKQGYGPYANKTAPVATEPQDQPKTEPVIDLIAKITA